MRSLARRSLLKLHELVVKEKDAAESRADIYFSSRKREERLRKKLKERAKKLRARGTGKTQYISADGESDLKGDWC